MVRFDSNILIKQQRKQQTQSACNVLLTIKYLYEAGAKVILVSDWDINNSQLRHTGPIAGKNPFFICHCKVWLLNKLVKIIPIYPIKGKIEEYYLIIEVWNCN